MSSEDLNPFASPQAAVSDVLSPGDDQLWPLQASEVAAVTPIPPPHAGRVRRPLYRFFVAIVAGLGHTLLVLSAIIGFSLTWTYLGLPYAGRIFGYCAIFITFAVFDHVLRPITFYRWWEARTRWWLETHREKLISAKDGRAQFFALTSTERPKFTSFRLSNNTLPVLDLGLCKLDVARGQLLLETDRRRYRIPRNSLLQCRVTRSPRRLIKLPIVHLAFQTHRGPEELELLLAQTTPSEVFGRFRQAEAFVAELLDMRPVAEPEEAIIVAEGAG